MKKVIGIVVLLGILFGCLRIYGFYRRETRKANERIELALSKIETIDQEMKENSRQSECNTQWLDWKLKEEQVKLVSITKGELAAATERAKMFKDKPVCDGWVGTADEGFKEAMKQLDLLGQKVDLENYIKLQKIYAKDRRAQTKELFRFITGS